MKPKNSDTSFWDGRRGKIFSRKGGWIVGEGVFNHGYSMLDDLVGNASFFQVLILNVTGKLPEKKIADWLEALFICLSWPDARIWCNQVGSLSGTLKTSPVAAVSAGILASDSRMYGPGTVLKGTEFIVDALKKKNQGLSVNDIIENHLQRDKNLKPIIYGYARPVATGDERIPAMERISKSLGLPIGEHLRLAYEVEKAMKEQFDEDMNLLGYCVAFLADQGFNGTTIYRLLSCWVNSGVHACYAEAYDNQPESFFPLRCNDIQYQGPKLRKVPDK